MRAWRLAAPPYQDREPAFNGGGAKKSGRRWNSKGTAVVYASATLALATLEILVNLKDEALIPEIYSAYRVDIPEDCCQTLERLPQDWRSVPWPASTQAIGNEWVSRAESVALQVPSSVIPEEFNYLLNPDHPDMKRLGIEGPFEFSLDGRLKSKLSAGA